MSGFAKKREQFLLLPRFADHSSKKSLMEIPKKSASCSSVARFGKSFIHRLTVRDVVPNLSANSSCVRLRSFKSFLSFAPTFCPCVIFGIFFSPYYKTAPDFKAPVIRTVIFVKIPAKNRLTDQPVLYYVFSVHQLLSSVLQRIEIIIPSAFGEKLLVRSLLGYLTVRQHNDIIGVLYR